MAHRDRDSDRLILAYLGVMNRKLNYLLRAEGIQMADLETIRTEIAENRSVGESAVSLINGLSQQLRDAAGDPAAIQALADELDANTQALAAAVTENTPHVDNTLPGGEGGEQSPS